MESFSSPLLAWFDEHGRKNLPWQIDPTPYRVWVSEIMLQQTQVTTVLAYYLRFMHRFPDVYTVSDATQDEVLHLWSGLGYYARGRNLHRAAQVICNQHAGEFPTDISALEALPGIGRSTAAAILSLACGQRHPILDGNVKRVLCRYHAIEGWPGKMNVTRKLWSVAEAETPSTRVAEYTQAIMDLGATICTRNHPRCERCPLSSGCIARGESRQAQLPTRQPKKDLPRREITFLIVRDEHGRFLLEKRPPSGIWGGLWGFPECEVRADPTDWVRRQLGRTARSVTRMAVVHHGFTHYHLDIHPVLLDVDDTAKSMSRISESAQTLWHDGSRELGLAAPVTELLAKIDRREAASTLGESSQ